MARPEGSNESKKLEDVGLETDEQQKLGAHTLRRSPLWAKAGGVRTALYSNSLLLVMTAIFLASWFGQSLGDLRTFNAEQREHSEEAVSWGRYLLDPDFWGEDAAELAVGVPRGRSDGGVHDLPPPAWVTRVEARRGAARRDRVVGLESDGRAGARCAPAPALHSAHRGAFRVCEPRAPISALPPFMSQKLGVRGKR